MLKTGLKPAAPGRHGFVNARLSGQNPYVRRVILQTTPKALIATNDSSLKRLVRTALQQVHIEAVSTQSDNEFLNSVHTDKPDLVIIDATLPDTGGLQLCRELRMDSTTADIPIIMITAAGNRDDKIEALEMGADDCVTRPPRVDELVAHIKAVRRRTSPDIAAGRIRAGPIELDLDRWLASVHDQQIELTKMEFRLLQTLLEAKGRALTRDFLLQKAWAHAAIHGLDTRTVDVHIGRLRRKLGTAGRYIITVRNVGFRFDIQPDWISGQPPK